MRFLRLYQLLDELRLRRNAVPARTLALELGVSLRTLYRDIADLQTMGAPIRGEGGVGYVLEPGCFIPSLQLDEDELWALSLGLRLVMERSDPTMSEAARRAAAKIVSAAGEKGRFAFLESACEAGTSTLSNTPHIKAFREAIRQRRVLQIDYTSLSGKSSRRMARPLGLTVFDSAWLLTIWCETATDFRHLRVDRIDGVRETGRQFRDERGKRFSDCLQREGHEGFRS